MKIVVMNKFFSFYLITYLNAVYSTWMQVKIPSRLPRRRGYICTYVRLPTGTTYATDFQSRVMSDNVERIFLFACSTPRTFKKYWYCNGRSPCADDDGEYMIYSWSKGVEDVELPTNVGFKLGKSTKSSYAVMKIYYSDRMMDINVDDELTARQFNVIEDDSGDGVDIDITSSWQKYVAGIYLSSAKEFTTQETSGKYHVDIGCRYHGSKMAPFAYRCEANGESAQAVLAYRVRDGKWALIADGDPRKAQVFYQIANDDMIVLKPDDFLASSCVYTEAVKNRKETWCKLYLMYYMVNVDDALVQYDKRCHSLIRGAPKVNTTSRTNLVENDVYTSINDVRLGTTRNSLRLNAAGNSVRFNITKGSDITLPDTEAITVKPHHSVSKIPKIVQDRNSSHEGRTPNLISNWVVHDKLNRSLGFISSVGLNTNGDVVALHRGWRNILANSFDDEHYYTDVETPITQDTIVLIDSATGEVLQSFGSNLLYYPHSLTVDSENNYWVADIGLHQVLKFSSMNTATPLLILGTRSIPGSDDEHFCEPTDVVVDKYGNVFVADGYCNSRIMKFNKNGKLVTKWGPSSPGLYTDNKIDHFTTPHSLSIDDTKGHLYVSDFRDGRILQFDTDGNFVKVLRGVYEEGKLFSIVFNRAYGGVIYTMGNVQKQVGAVAQIISTQTGHVMTKWNIIDTNVEEPYDFIVSLDNKELYVAVNLSLWKMRLGHHEQIEDGDSSENVKEDEENDYSEIRIIKASENDGRVRTAFIVVIVLGTPVVLSIFVMLVQYVILKLRHRKVRMKRNLTYSRRNYSGVLCHGCCVTRKHYFESNPGLDEFMIGSAEESEESEEELFARKT